MILKKQCQYCNKIFTRIATLNMRIKKICKEQNKKFEKYQQIKIEKQQNKNKQFADIMEKIYIIIIIITTVITK